MFDLPNDKTKDLERFGECVIALPRQDNLRPQTVDAALIEVATGRRTPNIVTSDLSKARTITLEIYRGDVSKLPLEEEVIKFDGRDSRVGVIRNAHYHSLWGHAFDCLAVESREEGQWFHDEGESGTLLISLPDHRGVSKAYGLLFAQEEIYITNNDATNACDSRKVLYSLACPLGVVLDRLEQELGCGEITLVVNSTSESSWDSGYGSMDTPDLRTE